MGDYFQTVVDLDATEEEAAALGVRALDWLVGEGIVVAERTDCVLGGGGFGHAPGPRYARAVDDPEPVNLWSNGLRIQSGRTVFDSGQGEPEAARCPLCQTDVRFVDDSWNEIDGAWDPFRGTFEEWSEGGGPGLVDCPTCERSSGIDRWTWEDDYFVCGHLGLTFWNWAELTFDFTWDLGRALGGHRTVVLRGKL